MTGYVSITTNASALAAALGDIAGKQIPFATALALTDVAFKVQRAEKTELQQSLTLRNRFSASGIQVNPAERSDWPVTYAEVGIEQKRSYLIDHVLGGKRQGGTHGRAILDDESMRSGSGRVPTAKRPSTLVARAMRAKRQAELNKTFGGKAKAGKPAPFLVNSSQWGGELLLQRKGDEVKTLYAFRKGVNVKAEFDMQGTADAVMAVSYHPAFVKALTRAIKTAR